MNPEERFEQQRTGAFVSDHYIFHFLPGSPAERDIREIAQKQERCFKNICKVLAVAYPEKIHYYFADSPLEIGRIFWEEGTPCNGCAVCGANKIYAVYNEKIKCIGSHEDTHLISFLLGCPESDFAVEGLAMFFDGLWWGVANETWTAYYKEKYPDISLESLLDNDRFAELGCTTTYPIAGAFTKFLVDTYGMERYLEFYRSGSSEYDRITREIFDTSLETLDRQFWDRMRKHSFDPMTLEEMLRTEGF